MKLEFLLHGFETKISRYKHNIATVACEWKERILNDPSYSHTRLAFIDLASNLNKTYWHLYKLKKL